MPPTFAPKRRRHGHGLLSPSVILLLLTASTSTQAVNLKSDGKGGSHHPSSTLSLGAEGDTYTFDTKVRTLEILKHLRQGDLPLEVLDEYLPGNGTVNFHVAMKAWDGSDFTCAPVPQPGQQQKKLGQGAGAGEEDESKGLVAALLSSLGEPPEALDQKLTVLENTCAMLRTPGYWGYEWCHRREVCQFHEISPPEGPEANTVGVRDLIWSLGKFVRTETRYFDGRKEKGVASVVDYFAEGQMCDETGSGRQTAVEFYCCSAETLPPEVRTRIGGVTPAPMAVAQLTSIKEVSTCNYSMIVCSPLLCDSDTLYSLVTLTGGAAKSQALRLLEPLASYCLKRHEGFWSYEFCYKGAIRQYHTVAVRDSTGQVMSKIESEYVIGAYEPVPENFKEEDYVVKREGEGEEGRWKGTFFEREYPGGTDCDLTGEKRATTVEFVCGQGPLDVFESIKEDRSCHYKAVISTPRLCRHPSFRKDRPATHVVQCERRPAQKLLGLQEKDGEEEERGEEDFVWDEDNIHEDQEGAST
eukprot:evm.model.NODE_3972_length_9029_cov_40.805073.1